MSNAAVSLDQIFPNDELEGFFSSHLETADPAVFAALKGEWGRQRDGVELIASENIVSRAVMDATGSVNTNKYAEGYPGRRYYNGCEHVDDVERLAIERAQKLFDCSYVNVQPHSGAQANQAVFMSLLKPGESFMGLSLASGGHLTHGAKPNQSGKWFNAVQYDVRAQDALIDFDQVEELAREHKPKLIIAGGSAYPRIIDFARFRGIADEVGALFMVDMAHFAGLVAGGVHPNPLDHADIVTTTTHKTLRSARGGMILSRNDELGKKINSAVFPGLQGGPLMHIIAGKAVGFGEALTPAFKDYAKQIVANAKVLGETIQKGGYDLVSGGTDTHLLLVDLRPKGLTGDIASEALERAAITCNKNGVPFDPEKPMVTSGIRLGTPAATTRGFKEAEFQLVGELIVEVLDGLAADRDNNGAVEASVQQRIKALCDRFPIYPDVF